MIITQQLIEKGKSTRGGWNRNQIIALGLDWPPSRGWRKRIEGNPISEQSAAPFLELKDAHVTEPAE